MRRLNQSSFGLVVTLVVATTLLAAGFVAWQVVNKNDVQSSCGNDRQCFYQAFNTADCTQKTIKTTQATVEGDPIVTTAKVTQNFEGCIIEITVDGSRDRFGDGGVRTYTCKQLNRRSRVLMASECTGDSEVTTIAI